VADRVLVTGANGALGRRLVARIARASSPDAVRAVVRREGAASVLRALPAAERPEVRVLDYGDAEALAEAASGCTAAVHLVGILKESSKSRYEDAHEGSARALARAAAAAGLRRAITLSILGAGEGSPNPCLASKGRAERILLDAVPALVLRLPMVLGPGDQASRALAGQARARLCPLVRGGATRQQPIFGGDVEAAILAGIARPGLDGAVLDLAGPESLPHRELVRRAARLLGTRPRIVPVPLALVRAAAFGMERTLGDPPLTRAMLEVLEHDDDVDPAPACRRLGLELTPLDETLRRCVVPEAS